MSFLSSLSDYMTGPIRRQADQEAMLRQAAIERMRSVQSAQAKLIPGLKDPTTNDTWQPPISVPANFSNYAKTGDIFNPGNFFDDSPQIVQQPGRTQPLMGQPGPQPGGLLGGPEQFKQYQQSLLNQANPDQAMQRMQMAPALEGMSPEQRNAFMIDPTKAADAYTKTAFPEMTPEQKISDAVAKMSPGDPRRANLQAYLDKAGYIREKDPLVIAQMKAQTAADNAGVGEKLANTEVAKARAKALSENSISDESIAFRANLALAGDEAGAFFGLPTGVYGSGARAKITDAWEKLATERGVTGSEMSRIKMQRSAANAALQQVSKRAGIADYNANEMTPLAKQLEDASKDVERVGWTDLNDLSNFAKSHTSNPEYGKLDVAVQGFKTAFAQALARNGVPTDMGRAKADKLFSGARNHIDLMARVAQAQKEAGAVVEAGETTKSQILNSAPGGSPAKPVGTTGVISPDIQKLIDQYAPK